MSDKKSVKKVEKMLGVKDTSVIPKGKYCYGGARRTKRCPYWSMDASKPEQENGYCSFLELGDWMKKGPWLLWDQVKECDINLDDE